MYLHQHGARSFHAGKDCRTRSLGVALAKEKLGRVGNLAQSAIGHLEDTDLVGWAETVLYRAQDAIVMSAFTFEIENAINHMLDHAGPAIWPSLVTCPTSTTAEPVCLA